MGLNVQQLAQVRLRSLYFGQERYRYADRGFTLLYDHYRTAFSTDPFTVVTGDLHTPIRPCYMLEMFLVFHPMLSILADVSNLAGTHPKAHNGY